MLYFVLNLRVFESGEKNLVVAAKNFVSLENKVATSEIKYTKTTLSNKI